MPHNPPQRQSRRLPALLGVLALALSALLFSGCNPNSPMHVLNYDSRLASMISDLFWPIIWVAIGIFVVVEGALVWAVIRFRERPGQPLPAQIHGNNRLEIAWTIAPTLVLAIIAFPTVGTIFAAATIPTGPDVVQIEVIGHQWWWEFRYPELGIVTANEFHVPQGKTAAFKITATDVIHSFWVPRLGGKRDAIPGKVNEIWYQADIRPGLYYGQCVEYCGDSHANMRIRAIVNTPEEWDAWVKQQTSVPGTAEGDAAVGRSVFAQRCAVCHTVEGHVVKGVIGPNLTHVGSRTSIGSGMYENTPENMMKWLRDPQAAKPGSKMIIPGAPLTESEIQALVAYLQSLK